MEEVFCPKDGATMRHIERNGVRIERCPECGGVFLDRGELERLIEAEAMYVRGDARADNNRAYDNRPYDYDYRGEHYGGHHSGHHSGHHGGHHGGGFFRPHGGHHGGGHH